MEETNCQEDFTCEVSAQAIELTVTCVRIRRRRTIMRTSATVNTVPEGGVRDSPGVAGTALPRRTDSPAALGLFESPTE